MTRIGRCEAFDPGPFGWTPCSRSGEVRWVKSLEEGMVEVVLCYAHEETDRLYLLEPRDKVSG